MTTLQPVPILTSPYNAETPLAALTEPITPAAAFYVRNHFDVPALNAADYRLRVDLGGGPAAALSLAELQALGRRTLTMTFECAGNGRAQLDPPVPGVRWGLGAVGTATFTGLPVATLVDSIGLRPGTVELLFDGLDRGEIRPGEVASFARSLPVGIAIHPDTLLAWEMNGEPLSADHGYPLRLVVPRWYGVASVKWLGEIRALSEPFRGYYQAEQYRYRGDAFAEADSPVSLMRVRALIAEPADGAAVAAGPLVFRGLAWSGDAPVARVELSFDDGRSWQTARLHQPAGQHAAATWNLDYVPDGPGPVSVIVRATDEMGNSQPPAPCRNEQGYGNNGVQRISLTVG